MDLIISDHTVPLAKADRAPKKVIDATPQYATDGDPAQGIPATIFPASHYNSVIAEITSAIIAGGKKLDKDNWGQLASVITDITDRFGNIKEVGKDAGGVYVIYEENGKDNKTYLLSPSDLDDINKRLKAAEATIVTHTGRLDNYGDAINRIFSQELPSKANLNGDGGQDFNTKGLNASDIVAGGIGIGGTNGLGTDKSLWAFSPQLLNDNNNRPSRNAILNLIYAGADSSADQPANVRQILQIQAYRTHYLTGDPNTTANDTAIHARSVSLYADCYVSGDANLIRKLSVGREASFTGKATFLGGTSGAKGDLAECYKSNRTDYVAGQVMMYSLTGDSEVELCTQPQQVFGIISSDPEHLMNVKDKGDREYKYYVPIALTGRIPVLVEGAVTRKDKLTPTNEGTVTASKSSSDVIIGRPLIDDLNTGLRLVECFVKAVL